jgi:hypothetical protein
MFKNISSFGNRRMETAGLKCSLGFFLSKQSGHNQTSSSSIQVAQQLHINSILCSHNPLLQQPTYTSSQISSLQIWQMIGFSSSIFLYVCGVFRFNFIKIDRT